MGFRRGFGFEQGPPVAVVVITVAVAVANVSHAASAPAAAVFPAPIALHTFQDRRHAA